MITKLVPAPSKESFKLSKEQCANVIKKKQNWSEPGSDRVECLNKGIVTSFEVIGRGEKDYPEWFTGGKTTLILKPGVFSSKNQRPITCLNTQYKWFTLHLLCPMDLHLDKHGLLESEQRGCRTKCSGTMDNLLIDKNDGLPT